MDESALKEFTEKHKRVMLAKIMLDYALKQIDDVWTYGKLDMAAIRRSIMDLSAEIGRAGSDELKRLGNERDSQSDMVSLSCMRKKFNGQEGNAGAFL